MEKDLISILIEFQNERFWKKVDPSIMGSQLIDIVSQQIRIKRNYLTVSFQDDEIQPDQSLEQQEIEGYSQLEAAIINNAGGGGTAFVDITEEGEVQEIQYGEDPPIWKQITEFGLYLQGNCTSQDCKIKNEQILLYKGMGKIDVLGFKDENKCPCCKSIVEVTKCGFTGCYYKYKGVKLHKSGKSPEPIQQKEYSGVDEETYRVFGGDSDDLIQWESLIVYVEDFSKILDELEDDEW